MSRVAKKPISLPKGVEVTLTDTLVTIKGPKGTLAHHLHADVNVTMEDNALNVTAANASRFSQAMSGTTRALLNNNVIGVSEGFERKLVLKGVGYRANAAGKKLNLSLGFSHPVEFLIPEGIKIETPIQTEIVITGVDKQVVGQVAANIRRFRPPEPYKGKGVRYVDEVVILKETKKK